MMFDIVNARIFYPRALSFAISICGSLSLECKMKMWLENGVNSFGIDARGTAMNVNYFSDAHFITLGSVRLTGIQTRRQTCANIHLRPNQYPSIRQINFRFQLTNIYFMCDWLCAVCTWQPTRWQIGELQFRFCTQMAFMLLTLCTDRLDFSNCFSHTQHSLRALCGAISTNYAAIKWITLAVFVHSSHSLLSGKQDGSQPDKQQPKKCFSLTLGFTSSRSRSLLRFRNETTNERKITMRVNDGRVWKEWKKNANVNMPKS